MKPSRPTDAEAPHESQAEAGGAPGAPSDFRRRIGHALPPGTPCVNCGAPLTGPWCGQCGQAAEDFHRSIWKLIGEALEGLLHFDGRVWTTLPDLILHPARLTRAYLDGHRAPQIPPLRLFLVVLVAVFLAGALGHGSLLKSTLTGPLEQMTPAQRAKAKAAIQTSRIELPGAQAQADWLRDRWVQVVDDPRRFSLVVEGWAERFAFLALPMATLLISVAFVFQRRFFIFDHAIFSLHSLSAVGLMVAASEALSPLIGGAAGLILWAAPIHLFAHMRGVYRTSVIGTLARMAFLSAGSAIIGGLLFLGLLLVGLNGMGG